jgi:3-dehydroquinate dehydratase
VVNMLISSVEDLSDPLLAPWVAAPVPNRAIWVIHRGFDVRPYTHTSLSFVVPTPTAIRAQAETHFQASPRDTHRHERHRHRSRLKQDLKGTVTGTGKYSHLPTVMWLQC